MYRYTRITCMILLAFAGVICLHIGNTPLNEGPTLLQQSSWLTTIGFSLLALSIGILFGGKFPRKINIALDILTAIASIVAMAVNLSGTMNFINESHSRFETRRLQSDEAGAQWDFQQVIISECLYDFGPRCSSLRSIDRYLATSSGLPLQQDVDIVCEPNSSSNTSKEVEESIKSGCKWLSNIRMNPPDNLTEADTNSSGLRQFTGSIVLAALLGFTLMRSLSASLNAKE